MQVDINKVKKILLIKPRGIGDIVLSTIILENIINSIPGCQIDYLTEGFAKPSVINNPLVTKVLTMGKKEFPLKVAFRIWKEKYDMVIDLWSNPRSAQITFLSRVKYRVGFNYRGRRYAYNIHATSERGDHHSAEHNLELLKPLNIPIISKKVTFIVDKQDAEFGKEFFEKNNLSGQKVAGIIPAGGWASKRCDYDKWIEICGELNNSLGMKTLILWGPGDEEDAFKINEALPNITILAPKTELVQMTGLMKYCSLIIANDSGPMHIAAAMDLPTLGIFGPTNPEAHKPYSPKSDYINKSDLHCIICNKLECPYNHECMKLLDPIDVINKVKEILERKI